MLGTADMGFLVYDSIEITNAAHCRRDVWDAEFDVCGEHFGDDYRGADGGDRILAPR